MSTITITVPDMQMKALEDVASRLGSSPEKLIQASIEELLKQSEPNIHQVISYLLTKNHELYIRLATGCAI